MSRYKKIKKLINKALEKEHLYQPEEIHYMKMQLELLKKERELKKQQTKSKGFQS